MCHCTQCRRMTGHIMAATAARRADFSLVSDGELKWYVSSVEARRGFCGRCGSTLFWEGVGLDGISIAAGTLDDTRGLKIACHIFVADKGDYRSEEHTSELQSQSNLVCRLLLEKKKNNTLAAPATDHNMTLCRCTE